MEKRRTVLKLGVTAAASALLAPLRALAGAATSQSRAPQPIRPTPAEENVVRAFFGQGWSEGKLSVIESHPATAQQCARLLERLRTAFPDLRVDVSSIAKAGNDTLVNWSAHGTQRGPLGGLAPTGRQVSLRGSSRMRIVNGKIVSSTAEWNEAELQKQLGTAAPR